METPESSGMHPSDGSYQRGDGRSRGRVSGGRPRTGRATANTLAACALGLASSPAPVFELWQKENVPGIGMPEPEEDSAAEAVPLTG